MAHNVVFLVAEHNPEELVRSGAQTRQRGKVDFLRTYTFRGHLMCARYAKNCVLILSIFKLAKPPIPDLKVILTECIYHLDKINLV
jgi:hypothetical protein